MAMTRTDLSTLKASSDLPSLWVQWKVVCNGCTIRATGIRFAMLPDTVLDQQASTWSRSTSSES